MSKYEEVANDIISKSINSVIYIDDDLLEPFNVEGEGSLELSKNIYDSFRNEDCSVDFYKFRDSDEWESKTNSTLRGKDMLILDWQLAKKGPEYLPTLKILSDAVKKPNLHFVCIYTETKTGEFDDIFYNINAHFAPFDIETLKSDLLAVEKIIEDYGDNFREIFDDKVIGMLKEMVIYPKKAGEIMNMIKNAIIDNSDEGLFKKIQTFFLQRVRDNVYPGLPFCYCGLGIAYQKGTICSDQQIIGGTVRNYVSQNFLIVNHTIILLTNKADVRPKGLYEKFRDALIHDSGNFLTLMGLEMRNLFRESSSFIGKDIDSINELAFFHHKEKSMPSESFYDFLRELWKSQAASFLYDKNNRPRIFDALDDYKEKSGIDEKMKTFISDPKSYVQHLGKLNYYYNTLVTSRPDNDEIKFGDVFQIKEEGKATNQYLLCITAHCDCLYAKDKINSMFYFVKGSKGNLVQALEKGDTGFDSYILNKTSIEVINWFDKPFTIFVKPERNNIDNNIEVILGEDKRELVYFATLKENYAQRIANSAFIYPLHVGIFFADTKK